MTFSALLIAAGCGDDAFRRYDAAVLAIEDGRNTSALHDATYASRHLSGINRQRACYVAGLAAARLEKPQEARRYLERASASTAPDVAGKAFVELGYLDRQENRQLQAAENFESAANRLAPPDNGRAWLLAGEAYTKAGRTVDARRCLAMAQRQDNPNISNTAKSRIAHTGYTIQFGSYNSKTNATRRATEVTNLARGKGLGRARTPQLDGEWKVQLGTFSDRRQASQALKRLGRSDAFVVQIRS